MNIAGLVFAVILPLAAPATAQDAGKAVPSIRLSPATPDGGFPLYGDAACLKPLIVPAVGYPGQSAPISATWAISWRSRSTALKRPFASRWRRHAKPPPPLLPSSPPPAWI